ncbi:MAG TPA: glycine cleavage T C-terminal barrel domain-containing protein, partial [Mycobacterium sp.]
RLSTVQMGTRGEWLPVFGGEAVRYDGIVIGRLRSVAYGPMVERTIGYVYRGAHLANLTDGARFTVDVFNEQIDATLGPDVLWDPGGERVRG